MIDKLVSCPLTLIKLIAVGLWGLAHGKWSIESDNVKEHHASDTQSSHLRLGILENSLMLFEIMIRSRLRAWAAIIVSRGPIVLPLDSRNALISP